MTDGYCRKIEDESDYEEIFINNFNKLMDEKNIERSASGSSSSSDDSEKREIKKEHHNKNSLDILKSYYKKGRILINHGEEGSSWNIGHVAMLNAESFDSRWYEDGLLRATISSFPGNGHQKVIWDGQIDGVQLEPIGYWCGTRGARNVKLYYVKNKTTNKDGRPTNAEIADSYYKAALKYANDRIGKPYPPYDEKIIGNYDYVKYKSSEDYFYCSSLVRSAWIYADSKISMGIYPWVAPSDIGSSSFTSEITKWSNYN